MKKIGKTILKIFGAIVGLLLLIILIGGFFDVPLDEKIAPEDYAAGSNSVPPAYSGLQREFPELNGATNTAQAELGRMLFFDPILSQHNEQSCADCHHPDKGFSDGLALSVGENGTELNRNAPSLWNVGFNHLFFWDGRVDTLEAQAEIPLTHPDEMGVTNPAELVAELEAIPEYGALFESAYGSQSVSFDNVTAAIAAFERTLVSNNSPFDQYAAGNFDALTASQRRGLTLFRSAATRCMECHTAPTFATDTLRLVGVPDSDLSEELVKVPSLRNVALSAPYMHNGSLATLEEVVDFYAAGGGRQHGIEGVDAFILGFDLTDQDRTDLVNFLYALTDESNLPEIPTAVPSGLAVVQAVENPARALVATINTGTASGAPQAREPQEFTVQPGETVQSVVDRAQPGDTVLIPYGIYHERVSIDLSDFTLLGIPNEAGEYPVFDGEGKLSEAVIASGNNFEVGYLKVINYQNNGIIVEGVVGVHMHHCWAENTGIYGLYPVKSTNVLVEDSVVIGANDAGVYAGQSENVVVRNNEVYENVLGIEVENTVGSEVYGNNVHDNTMGILVVVLPNLTSKVSLNTLVYDNLVENNNHANFAIAGTAAALAPPGTGIGIIGSDEVEVRNNTFIGNQTAAIGIFDLNIAFEEERINIPGTPENVYIHDNTYENNGYDADPFVTDMGLAGVDVLWDGSGAGIAIDDKDITTFPPMVPDSSWSDFGYNMYWRVLNFLVGLL